MTNAGVNRGVLPAQQHYGTFNESTSLRQTRPPEEPTHRLRCEVRLSALSLLPVACRIAFQQPRRQLQPWLKVLHITSLRLYNCMLGG